MSLHLCIDCATIREVPEGVNKICRKCRQALIETDNEKPDRAAPFNAVAGWALFGLPEEQRGH